MKTLIFIVNIFLICFSDTAFARVISISKESPSNIEKSTLEFSDTSGIWHYGRGYNSLSGHKAGFCVINSEPRNIIPHNNSQKVYFEMSKISSSSDLIKKLSLEASAGLKLGIGEFSGKASFANESRINNYSVYLLIKIEVRNGEQSFNNDIELKQSAYQLLEKSPEEFFKRCGDEFVEGISTGAEFYALLEIETDSIDKQRFVNASLKGTYGQIFGGSTQFSTSLLEIMRKHSTKLKIYQSGGVKGAKFSTAQRDGTVMEEIRLPQDPDELITYAAGFSSKVTLENSKPIFATTSRYDQLLSVPFGRSFFDTKIQDDVLNYLAKTSDRLKENLNNIEYISQNFNQFISPDLEGLDQARTELSIELNKIIDYATKCIRDFKCEYPTDLKNITFTLPLRKSVNQECEMRESKVCGIKEYNTGRNQVCGVEEYHSGEDASCGVELFKNTRSEHCGPETYNTGTGPVCGIDHYNSRADGNLCGLEDHRTCQRGPFGIGHKCTTSKRPKTCEHPSFGVASYKICSHPDFGVSVWKSCINSDHGVEKYKSCPNAKFGVKAFRECENEIFGVLEYNTCLLEKGKDQICSSPEME